jgi:hypothetical protein
VKPIGFRTAVVALALVFPGCSGAREHALLDRFFSASRIRDLTALHNVATVVFEPREQGTVLGFDITSIRRRGDDEDVDVSANVRLPTGEIARQDLRVTITGGFVTSVTPAPRRR